MDCIRPSGLYLRNGMEQWITVHKNRVFIRTFSIWKHVSLIGNLFYSHFLTIKKGSQNNYSWPQNYFTESYLGHHNTRIRLNHIWERLRRTLGQPMSITQVEMKYSDGIIQVRPFTILHHHLNKFSVSFQKI